MRIAILDLGTNTFNLLIADYTSKDNFQILFKTKRSVKLGQNGINEKIITSEAFERGLKALRNHNDLIQKHNVEKTFAFATSAIRNAKNGSDFVAAIKLEFNIEVTVITGENEAELIYYGVKQAVNLTSEKVLILDIGGGSNEFIIANNNEIFWKQSFNLGIARLIEKFPPSNPIKKEEIETIHIYLEATLDSLFEALNTYPITTLVGASGSFDTLRRLNSKTYEAPDTIRDIPFYEISIEKYLELHKILINSTTEERIQMKGLELMRVEMIVLASIFINFIVSKAKIKRLIQSDYALKEGVIKFIEI